MSIMKLLGVRSWALSFVEIVFFFCVLSVAYFAFVIGGYHLLAGEPSDESVVSSSLSAPPQTQTAPAEGATTQEATGAPAEAIASATAPAETTEAPAEAAIASEAAPAEAGEAATAPATAPAAGQEEDRSWLVSTPVWMWIIAGVGYILLVTLYWAPGDKPLDDAELRAFGAFIVVAVLTGLLWLEMGHDHAVSRQAELFWKIVSGRYTVEVRSQTSPK